MFIIISFLLRAIHGFACGIIEIVIYSLISSISTEEEIQMALGYMEIAWCIGLSAGPLFASIFYEIGGFTLPFLVLGSLLYISVFLTKIVSIEAKNNLYKYHSFYITRRFTSLKTIKKKKLINYNLLPSSTY